MDLALPRGYARSWAQDHVLAELDGRTVEQSLGDGVAALTVWRAVHAELELPARDR
jgi:hypothetical protein